jgi:hypothetical protein
MASTVSPSHEIVLPPLRCPYTAQHTYDRDHPNTATNYVEGLVQLPLPQRKEETGKRDRAGTISAIPERIHSTMKKIVSTKATSADSGNFKPLPANADLSAKTVARHGLINKAATAARQAGQPTDRPGLHFKATRELQRKARSATIKPVLDAVDRP